MSATVSEIDASTSAWPEVAVRNGRGSRWGVASTAAALALAGVAFVAIQAGTPSDGTHLRPGSAAMGPRGLVVSPLRATGGPLREGDVVVGVGNVPVQDLVGQLVGGAPDLDPVAVDDLRAGWRHGARLPYDVLRAGEPLRVEVELGPAPLAVAASRTWGTIVFAIVNLLVVGLVFARRPDEPAVRVLFVGAGALVGATAWSLGLQVGDVVRGAGFWLYQALTVPVFMVYWSSVAHFAAVFPRPLSVARAWWFAPVLHGAPIVGLVATIGLVWGGATPPLDRVAALAPVWGVQAAVYLGLALAALLVQYRRTGTRAQRQQIRWVVLAALIAGVAGLAFYLLPPLLGSSALSPNVMGAVATVFPVAVAVAVLHHKLFDIDTLINRTLVYGALTFAIGAGYVLVVTLLGGLFQARGGLAPALLATGLVAVVFQPLRERVQAAVNRLMYGERDDPAAVLGRLGARLEGTLVPDEVLPTLVATVADALRLPYVAIERYERHGASGVRTVAAYGHPRHRAERFPLAYRGEPIGELVAEPRGADEVFTGAEATLLETIARQASVATYALRVTDDLRRSRERLVSAREEERRRLRHELHDGLGPALASLTLKLDAASNVLDRDADAARALLRDLREQVQGAIDDLRVVVHALRPPALDDLGLVRALREQVRRSEHAGLEVAFHAPASLPAVPAGVEVAAYRVVQEALTNVVRHARARHAWVRVAATDVSLTVEVADDGVGVAHARRDRGRPPGGVGLASMRERAMELGGTFELAARAGGGTRLTARFPMSDLPVDAGHATKPTGARRRAHPEAAR